MAAPPPQICVVDDDPSIRQALRRLLQAAGYRAALFASAEEFLHAGDPAACDCLILDVRMPGMGGFHLQDCLARSRIRLPIVFITAHRDEVTRMRSMAGGAVTLLPKPFEEQALLDALATALAPKIPPGTAVHPGARGQATGSGTEAAYAQQSRLPLARQDSEQ